MPVCWLLQILSRENPRYFFGCLSMWRIKMAQFRTHYLTRDLHTWVLNNQANSTHFFYIILVSIVTWPDCWVLTYESSFVKSWVRNCAIPVFPPNHTLLLSSFLIYDHATYDWGLKVRLFFSPQWSQTKILEGGPLVGVRGKLTIFQHVDSIQVCRSCA